MKQKVCVVTGTRAEYGLLHWVMKGLQEDPKLDLQVMATGMHLSPQFGLTYRQIESDGFTIDRKVEALLSADSTSGLAKSMGLGIIGFADAFQDLCPDLVLVLGDRYEIFAAASAAMMARIPIVHIHGGEISEGVIDEAIRHSLTKMSHLHFVATKEYRRRVIQLGEQPDRVFVVGGLGVDGIGKLSLMNHEALGSELEIEFRSRNLLITFHPVTLEPATAGQQMVELLAALGELQDTCLIFTMPNADIDSGSVIRLIEDFVSERTHAYAFTTLGQLRYLSCMQYVDGVVGNSSSGLTEVPTFCKGTVNIGDRQRGRLRAESVIDCDPSRASIGEALMKLYAPDFQESLKAVRNPYGEGGASEKIVQILRERDWSDLLKKRFYDLPA